jgi:hypothetical protein
MTEKIDHIELNERESRLILEKEVRQWFQMEEIVKKYAFIDENIEMIIFLTPNRCSRMKSLFEPLSSVNFAADM